MWITLKKKGNTVYQHVDRLCTALTGLYTEFRVLAFQHFLNFFNLSF